MSTAKKATANRILPDFYIPEKSDAITVVAVQSDTIGGEIEQRSLRTPKFSPKAGT